MLQHDTPEDFIIASGEQHSVREFVELAAKELGMEILWEGEGVNEIGRLKSSNKNDDVIIKIDPKYFRPTEVDTLLGDPSKAQEKLGWKSSTSFSNLIKEMVLSDFKEAEKDHMNEKKGYSVLNSRR